MPRSAACLISSATGSSLRKKPSGMAAAGAAVSSLVSNSAPCPDRPLNNTVSAPAADAVSSASVTACRTAAASDRLFRLSAQASSSTKAVGRVRVRALRDEGRSRLTPRISRAARAARQRKQASAAGSAERRVRVFMKRVLLGKSYVQYNINLRRGTPEHFSTGRLYAIMDRKRPIV